jgi:hypothetical protein
MEETTRHLRLYMPGDFDKLNPRFWPRWGARVHPWRWQAQATNTLLNPNASQGCALACPVAGVLCPLTASGRRHRRSCGKRDSGWDRLREMGADILVENLQVVSSEPVADTVVRARGIRGIEVRSDRVPRMIDEFPISVAVASQAEGTTVVSDAAELQIIKERIVSRILPLNCTNWEHVSRSIPMALSAG